MQYRHDAKRIACRSFTARASTDTGIWSILLIFLINFNH